MVVTGPLLAQPIIKPPVVESEIVKAINELKKVGSGRVPLDNNTTYNNGYSNSYLREKSVPYIEKSSKYADLFTVFPQSGYYQDNNIAMYPVDNEPLSTRSQFIPQKETTAVPNMYDKNPFNFDKVDFDLTTLLATPFPKQEPMQEYTIPEPTLDFMNFPPAENVVPDNSVPAVWGGMPKIDDNLFQNLPQVDPFVNEFSNEPRLYPVPSTDSLLTDMADQASPISTATISSPMKQETPWENEFPEFLDTPLDFSSTDFFLPPPAKRIHDSNETLMSPHYPSSPETVSEVHSPIVDEDYVKPKPKNISKSATGKTKSKSTILFGKHEDEIIHKLLVPHLSTPSRPINHETLVSMPVEEFNHLLELAQLNDIEVAFMKEWRRRGKNKTAAQVARKRKREEVGDLEVEVQAMRQKKAELEMKYRSLQSQIKSYKQRSATAEKKVYKQLSNSSGKNISRDTHHIHVAHGNKLLLVPKMVAVN